MLVMISRRRIVKLSLCGILFIALNFLAYSDLSMDEIEKADLNGLAGHIFVLDPGHGGVDGGATGNGVVEKEVTLKIAKLVGENLTSHGATVIMTREEDVDYYTRGKGGKRSDLEKRIELINSANAELFISIHLNAIRDNKLSGAQVFFGGKSEESKKLAEIMQNAVKSLPPGNPRKAKQDLNILVLNETNIPGVLVECGYVTNKAEAGNLATNEYQRKIALQITKGLAYHFNRKVSR